MSTSKKMKPRRKTKKGWTAAQLKAHLTPAVLRKMGKDLTKAMEKGTRGPEKPGFHPLNPHSPFGIADAFQKEMAKQRPIRNSDGQVIGFSPEIEWNRLGE